MEVPLIGKRPLGPIHTLIRDSKGKVYLSDEINNRVLCLTEQGELLWWHGVDSADPIGFRYPRGLALGRISTENAGLAECLAVCDSWNNRVVFLSLGCGQIGEWRTAGDLPLREVSDIRYIENPERTADGVQESLQHCWLLLDRGNHRLCWLGLDGQLLTQVGPPGGPQIEPNSKYPVFELMAEKYASPIPKAFPPYNLLHHPSRIVGAAGQLLAVSESLGQSLKLIHDGFLYPLPLNRTCDTWLALDDFGFLGWEKADRVLVFLDLNGTEFLRIPTNGVPVCADLGDREWWEQQGQTLSRHSFVYPLSSDTNQNESKQKSVGMLQRLAALDIASIDLAEAEAALDDYLGCLRRLLTLANEVVLMLGEPGTLRTLPQPSSSLLDETLDNLKLKIEPVKHGLEMLCSATLKWRVCCFDRSSESPDSSLRFQFFIRRVQGSLSTTFIALAASLDRLVLAVSDSAANSQRQNDRLNNLNETRSRIDAALWPIGKFLSDCFNLLHGFDGIVRRSPAGSVSSERDLNGVDQRAHSIFGSWKTYGLKEIDRWQLDVNGGLHRCPRNLALSKNGTINISFGQSNSILEMDPAGRPVRQSILPAIPGAEGIGIGPNGIAWDENGRLWLTYGSLKCVVIWDVSRNSIQVVNGIEESINGFNVPFAICKGAPGQMLMTDYEDHRIIGISYQGRCKCLAGGRGRIPGQFISPGCLLGIQGPGPEQPCAIWVVDHRNHRLQKLSLSGDFISELGGCGLERGRFALPIAAAAFSDGTLAVSMWHLIRCLMLVSPEGEELGGIAIDFVPEGMLVVEDRLFVADCAGNQIRVYGK